MRSRQGKWKWHEVHAWLPGRTEWRRNKAHTRRKFFDAQGAEPRAAAEALDMIGALYRVEEHVREHKLKAARKLDYRTQTA